MYYQRLRLEREIQQNLRPWDQTHEQPEQYNKCYEKSICVRKDAMWTQKNKCNILSADVRNIESWQYGLNGSPELQ